MMKKITNIIMMMNYIGEWVGDKLIEIPWIKHHNDNNKIEYRITECMEDIRHDLTILYRFKNISYKNRLLINIHERLNDLKDLRNIKELASADYYEWIVNENLNNVNFIQSWCRLVEKYDNFEIDFDYDTINDIMNHALMVIYDRIYHRKPLTALELYDLKLV